MPRGLQLLPRGLFFLPRRGFRFICGDLSRPRRAQFEYPVQGSVYGRGCRAEFENPVQRVVELYPGRYAAPVFVRAAQRRRGVLHSAIRRGRTPPLLLFPLRFLLLFLIGFYPVRHPVYYNGDHRQGQHYAERHCKIHYFLPLSSVGSFPVREFLIAVSAWTFCIL